MKKQKSGKIINVSSTPAIAGHTQGHAYTAAKAAVMGLTKDLALEAGNYNITVNCIAPGNIETGWAKTLSKKQYKSSKEEAPLKRWGQPLDIARVALFLASELSNFVTGQTIIADGGTVIR
jgi:3-oxoacyl-[acyl-carrier protein] reductase